MSDFFDVTLGVKHGESLSPLLFIVLVNDIVNSIDYDQLTDYDINMLSMFLILFADIVLFTTDPVSLQDQINNLCRYSEKWGLKINVRKTKVCIFEKRRQFHIEDFYINGEIVEKVEYFIYLFRH